MKILYFFICLFALATCSKEQSNTTKTGDVEISLTVLSQQLQSTSFTISNIQLFNDQDRSVSINKNAIQVNWVNGQQSSLYLLKIQIPEGIYTDIAFDVTLNDQSFSFIDDQLHSLFMIDSLNRSIPDEINVFSIRTNLNQTQTSINKNHKNRIDLIFDADKSVQALYKEDNTTVLFKPYFYSNKEENNARSFYARLLDSNFDTLSLSSNLTQRPIHIPLSQIHEIQLNGETIAITTGIHHLLQNTEDLMQVTEEKNFSIQIYANKNRLNIIQASIRVDSNNNQTLEGQILDGSQKITGAGITLNLDTRLFSPQGEIIEKNHRRLLNGQLASGFITEEDTVIHLHNSKLIAVINTMNPTTITPLIFNNYPVQRPSTLSVKLNHLTSANPGDLIALKGYALNDIFYTKDETLLDINQTAFSVILPSSLSRSPLSDILHETTFVLSPHVIEIAHTVVSIDNTPIHTSTHIEYIDTRNANFTIYSDRVLESKRLYHYEKHADAINAFKAHLLDAHHINEIHAKGQIQNNVLHASEIHIIFYGSSILDELSSDQVLIDIEEEANNVPDKDTHRTKNKEATNNTALVTGLTLAATLVTGLTLAVGATLVTGIAFLLFKKSINKSKEAKQSYLETPLKKLNLSPIYSPDRSTKTHTVIRKGIKYQVKTLDTGEILEAPITPFTTNTKPTAMYQNIITENGITYEKITLDSGEVFKFPTKEKQNIQKPNTIKEKSTTTFIMNYQGGRILKKSNVLYFEQTENGEKTLSEVIQLSGSNDYVSAGRTAEDHADLNINEWFLKKYPHRFKRGNNTIKFNNIEIQDIIDNRAMIDTELAVQYLSAFSKKHNDLLFFKGLAENHNIPTSNQNSVITKGAIDQNFGGSVHGGENTKTRLANFITDFSKTHKKFAILPALGSSQHFNALILVKDDTTKSITPILIEPGDGSIAKGISQEVKNLLPQPLQNKAIILQTKIQTDGCSCGPIAMVTAADIISKIQEKSITARNITLADVSSIVNELKATDKYKAEDQHPRIRIDMLRTLDPQNNINKTPLDDADFTKKINTYKPRKN